MPDRRANRRRTPVSLQVVLTAVLAAVVVALPAVPAQAAVSISATPSSAIGGENVRVAGNLGEARARSVQLQQYVDSVWTTLKTQTSSSAGAFAFTYVAPTTVGNKSVLRVKAPSYSLNGQTIPALTSATAPVTTVSQTASLTAPTSVVSGESFTATGTFKPIRAGRTAILQRLDGSTWVEVGRTTQNSTGTASFTTSLTGTKRWLRVLAPAANGAPQAISANRAVTVTAATDTTPPPAPTGLKATLGNAQVSLSWTAVTASDLAGYRVYKRTSTTEPWTQVGVTQTGTTATVTGLTNGTYHYFRVSAIDTSGNQAYSAAVGGKPIAPDTTPPPAPTGLTATPGNAQVALSWTAVTASDLAGYRVYRGTSATGPWTQVGTGTQTGTTRTVTGLTNGTTYWFRVSSIDATGNQAYSANVTSQPAPADTTPPQAPTDLMALAGDGQVTLTWSVTDEIDPAVGFNVQQASAAGGPWTTIASNVAETQYVATGLTNGQTLYFRVRGVDAAGNISTPTAVAQAKPNGYFGTNHCGTLEADETWEPGVHILDCPVIVPAGKTLTVIEGAMVKAAAGSSLTIQGALEANGTEVDPIIFTSLADDSVGGDTRADGDATVPHPGIWYGIHVAGSSADAPASVTADRVIVRYGPVQVYNGADDDRGAEYVERTVSVTNSQFEKGAALAINNSGPITVTENSTENSTESERNYAGGGISVTQYGYLASTTVTGNAVDAANACGISVFTDQESAPSPVVRDNFARSFGGEPICIGSNNLRAENLTGNTSSNTAHRGLSLTGRLVTDMTLPFGDLPLVIGAQGNYTGLTVASGSTLTVQPGVVVRGDSGGSGYVNVLHVLGTLDAQGTVEEPIIFTGSTDDVAGDYNGDGTESTTAPGAWGGIRVGGTVDEPGSITLDHATVRYASLGVSGSGDDRDAAYVERTTSITNSLFEKGSALSVDNVGPITVTGNVLRNTTSAERNHSGGAIRVAQYGYLSGTNVSDNDVDASSGCGIDVRTEQESAPSPVVRNNVVRSFGAEPLCVSSLQLRTENLTGNTSANTAYRGLALAGRLVTDMTLPFGNLPVTISEQGGYYGGLTIGSDATLTVNPGVVVRAHNNSGWYSNALNVNGTLDAHGTAELPVIFTTIEDDSAGGDYNGDGATSVPAPGRWAGISVSGVDNDHPASLNADRITVRYGALSYAGSGDDRDAAYVDRTVSVTNSRFEKGSALSAYNSGPITVTGNTVTSTTTAERNNAGGDISVAQSGYLATTTVTGNTVNASAGCGIHVSTSSQTSPSPVVRNNSARSFGAEPICVSSDNLRTENLTGNTSSNTSYRGLNLTGRLVTDLTLPFGDLPLTIGNNGYDRTGLTVDSDATLTVNAGVVVKAHGTGGWHPTHLTINGTLDAHGTAEQPVVFSTTEDDASGGDYRGDGTTTTASPGHWAGINVTGMDADSPASVLMDRVTVRYAPLIYSDSGDDRDAAYVDRTASITNSRFEKGSAVSVSNSGPITVTGNVLSNTTTAERSNAGGGVDVYQSGFLGTTTVSGNTVTTANGCGVAVTTAQIEAVSPVVRNNTARSIGAEPVCVASHALRTENLTGNTSTNPSFRGLNLSGRLLTDMTLPFGDLPLTIGNSGGYIGYGGLTIGTGATLTINAGVVVKAYPTYWTSTALGVEGSLDVNGTSGSPVIFTSLYDDTAGGDYNGDGTVSQPGPGNWAGIWVAEGGSAELDGVDIRYADTALDVQQGGSASIHGKVGRSSVGVRSAGYYVDATNVDWGHPSGPAPDGEGVAAQGSGINTVPWVGYVPPPRPPVAEPQPVPTDNADNCAKLVVLGLRGSGEPPNAYWLGFGQWEQPFYENETAGFGGLNWDITTSMVDRLKELDSSISDDDVKKVAVQYLALGVPPVEAWHGRVPASIPSYIRSIYDGADKLTERLHAEVRDCPDAKFVLVGYSQGALSIHIILRLLSTDMLDRIAGVGLVADPGRARFGSETVWSDPSGGNSAWAYGSWGIQANFAIADGTLAGPLPSAVTGKTLSVCNDFDMVCGAYPLANPVPHTRYNEFTTPMGHWLAERVAPSL